MRLGVRGIGLVSTIILARLLVPADFGIVAMAMLVISFIELFTETGQQTALIRHPAPERAHYDTAWTMSVLISLGLTAIALSIAPFADLYFRDERIVPVIQLLSLRILLLGFLNIGVIDFRRDLNFAREFKFGLLRKLLTFTVTVSLALTLRNYWALAIGVVVGTVAEISLSYLMHPHRPRINLTKVKELWSYSIWILIAGIGQFFQGRIDEVAVAGVAPPGEMGQYTVGAELGALPGSEILDPISRALFPNYAKLASQPERLGRAYLYSLSAAVLITSSLATGLALVASDLVAVLLGPKWVETATLVPWFAMAAAVAALGNTVFAVLNAAGESRSSAIQSWTRTVCYAPAMFWAAGTHVLVNFAIAKLIVAVVLLPTFFMRLRKVVPIRWAELVAAIWRPPVAAVAMSSVVLVMDVILPTSTNPFLHLPLEVFVGASTFIGTLGVLWLTAGRPDGLERDLWGWIASSLRRS